MAKLMYVYRSDELTRNVGRRQLPLNGGENLMMLMDLSTKGLVFDNVTLKNREVEEFTRKYVTLTYEELKKSLEVTSNDFTSILGQTVPCVGCRRSVERLFYQLMLSNHPTLEPIIITKKKILTITDEALSLPHKICHLLYKHNILLNSLLDNQQRNKKSSRCNLHSLDSFRSRPFSEIWKDVWNCMKGKCKEEIAVVEAQELHTTLDNYLKKHKFCQECRTKVEKAYGLLVNEQNPKEKGYVPALYSGIRRCVVDKHIHIQTKTEYIDNLIKRAEPELNGSNSRHRERHAKTLEIAQEEVLTCIGMCLYERLRRIHMCLKEEENACQVLAAVAVHALSRSFDMAVETKRGISNLELLYEEISRAEKVKEHRKEQKKLKKKKKKYEKKHLEAATRSCHSCEPEQVSENCYCSNASEELDEEVDDDDDEDNNNINNNNLSKNHLHLHHSNHNHHHHHNEQQQQLKQQQPEQQKQLLHNDNENLLMCNVSSIIDKQKSITTNNLIKPLCYSDVNNDNNNNIHNHHAVVVIDDNDVVTITPCQSCVNKFVNGYECTKSIDGGYVSEPSSHHDRSCSLLLSSSTSSSTSRTSSIVSSPEGSEIACSDGFCNHDQQHDVCGGSTGGCSSGSSCRSQRTTPDCADGRCTGPGGLTLTLQQMLDDSPSEDEEETRSFIPDELVLEFKSRKNITQEREELRQNLRKNFAQLCMKQKCSVSVGVGGGGGLGVVRSGISCSGGQRK